MAKTKKKKTSWLWIGLLAAVIAAPNATVIKYTVNGVDPYYFNAIRFLLIALITTPFLLRNIKLLDKGNFKHSLKAGLYMSIAVVSYVWAIKLSHASYVSIIILLSPIFFILYSAKLTGEKISPRAVTGIILAAIGAMVIVILPIAIKQNGPFIFYPLATVFALVNCMVFPLSIISFKKANDGGLPIIPLLSFSSWLIFLVNICLFYVIGGSATSLSSGHLMFGIIYSGIVVSLISRIMNVVSYEHIGGAVTGAIAYFETFLAITIPIVILGEKLSKEMVTGGILILAGIYVIQYHKTGKHKRHFLLKTH